MFLTLQKFEFYTYKTQTQKDKNMKKHYTFLAIICLFIFSGCEKTEEAITNATGSFTAKFSYYITASSSWSPNENFVAKTVVTTKTGNEYVIVATDLSGNVLTVYGSGVTGVGKFQSRGIFVKAGKTYSSTSGQLDVTALSGNSLTANFIVEATDWSMFEGKLSAKF